jgi:tetratricopeptide (TPR) repeat protein
VRRALIKALEPVPGNRYRSMDELIDALSADPRARWRRAAVATLAVAAVGGGAFAIAVRGGAPPPCVDAPRHLADVWSPARAAELDRAFVATGAPFAIDTAGKVRTSLDARASAWIGMHRDACLATRVRGEQSNAMLDLRMSCLDRRRDELDALIGELVRSPDVERVRNAVDAVRALPDVASCADKDALTAVVPPPTDPVQRAAIDDERRELAAIKALIDTGQWAEGRDRAERAQTRARQLGWAPLVAEAAYQRGQAERHSGHIDAAEAALTEAAQEAARAHLDDLSAMAWSELVAVVGYEESRPVEGLALAVAADAAVLRADAPPDVVAGLHHARAMTLMSKGDSADALKAANAALAIAEQRGDDVEAAEVLNTIGMIQANVGDYAASEQAHRRVLAGRAAAFGAGHPKVADSLDNLGVVLHHTGRYAEARDLYERGLELRIAALGNDHRDVGTSHNNLGGLLMDMGEDAAATRHLEEALANYETSLGKDHADLAYPLSNLGELATRRADFAQAIAYCERALDLEEAATSADDPDLAYDLTCLGEARLGQGDVDAARAVLERAMKLRAGKVDAGEKARTRFALAQALWRSGDRGRARELAETAQKELAGAGDAWTKLSAKVRQWLDNPR